MSRGGPRDGGNEVWLAAIGGLVLHLALAGGLGAAENLGWGKEKKKADTIEIAIVTAPPPPPKLEPPPPPPPPPVDEPPPPPPPKALEPPPKVEPKKIAAVRPVDETPPPPVDAPPPAPGPAEGDAPAEEYTYKMPAGGPGGSMGVEAGAAPTGKTGGVKGGTGSGRGGDAPPDATGTGPRAVSAARIKTDPQVDGEFDYVRASGREYPDAARAAGVQGKVQVRILVDDRGRPAEVKIHGKGLGHGLDQKALEYARKLRFKPARDTDDKAVATWITWDFDFVLPE